MKKHSKRYRELLKSVDKNKKIELKELIDLVKKGFARFRIDNEIYTSENIPELQKNKLKK